MASREQGRGHARRATVEQDDVLAEQLLDAPAHEPEAERLPFPRFASTSERLAALEASRAERFAAERPERADAAPPNVPAPTSELTRVTERLVEAREALARANEQLEAQRAAAQYAAAETAQLQQRLVAARGLVLEAQRTAQHAAERCAFVEGRCDALELALDKAVSATFWRRMLWRRARATR